MEDARLVSLVDSFGGAVSPAIFDPGCERLELDGTPGTLGYRRRGRCAVAYGEPICAADDRARFLDAFRDRFPSTIFVAAGEDFASLAEEHGYASIEYGEELVFDPRAPRPRGRRGHELQRKLNLAARSGLRVVEYRRDPRDPRRERALEKIKRDWLAARQGMQIYLANVDLWHPAQLRRWFVAEESGVPVGLLVLTHLGARGGWLLEHLLPHPSSRAGTSEALVASALATLGGEGCAFATFGPAPSAELGRVEHLSPTAERVGRWCFARARHIFDLDSLARYRRKFGGARTERSFLLVHPHAIGLRQILALATAFHVSRW